MHLDDSLLLGGSFSSIAYVGVIEASSPGGVETTLEDHGGKRASLISKKEPQRRVQKLKKERQGMVGRLAGAAAFERVTKAYKGFLMTDGKGHRSVRAQGSLTVRPTRRAGTQVGSSDPVISQGGVIAQRIKGTLGITG